MGGRDSACVFVLKLRVSRSVGIKAYFENGFVFVLYRMAFSMFCCLLLLHTCFHVHRDGFLTPWDKI